MTIVNLNPASQRQLSSNNLVSYLLFTNWQEVNEGNKWQVFTKHSNSAGELEIVLPFNKAAYDYPTYAETAVNLLSALNQETFEQIIFRINHYDTDVLNLRNLKTNSYESIPLDEEDSGSYIYTSLLAYRLINNIDETLF